MTTTMARFALAISLAAVCSYAGCTVDGDDEEALTTEAGVGTCGDLTAAGVTASGNDGNLPANVLDGNLGTRWSSNGIGQSITADLGTTKALCSASIAWYRGNLRTSDFTFSVSTDGTGFTSVYSGKSSGKTTALENYDFADVNARYLRVTVNGNSENQWASITELRAIGGDGAPGQVETLFGAKKPGATEAADGDSQAVELGVKFQSTAAGNVKSVRFYRAAANAAGYSVHLWTSSGTLLGTATGKDAGLPGWQEVAFASPITITPNTTYVASYFTSNGHYAGTNGGFTSALTSGHLSAPSGAGVYRYGASSGFPTSTWQSSNYWVDVAFVASGAGGGSTGSGNGGGSSGSGTGGGGPTGSELHATPGTLASVFAGASGGSTILLASGNYGTFQGGTKSSTVTLEPESGAAVNLGFNFNPAANVRIDGVTITDANIDGASHDITVQNCKFTGMAVIRGYALKNANIVFDHNTHANVNVCNNCYEGRVQVVGDSGSASGVVIKNSVFGPGGNSDGIQNGGNGVQILDNEFVGIVPVDDVHTDSLQLYGSRNTVIKGNYFHDGGVSIMAPDGTDHELITDNVFMNMEYPFVMMIGGDNGSTIVHNTVGNAGAATCAWDIPCGVIIMGPDKQGTPNTGSVVRDNIISELSVSGGGSVTSDYNLISSAGTSGAHDIKGKATFVGGAAPSTYAAFKLGAGSLGKANASDGLDRGVRIP